MNCINCGSDNIENHDFNGETKCLNCDHVMESQYTKDQIIEMLGEGY